MKIRKGVKEDLQGVLALINELARYEKAADEVAVTIEQLARDGFPANGGSASGGKIVNYNDCILLSFLSNSMVHLSPAV